MRSSSLAAAGVFLWLSMMAGCTSTEEPTVLEATLRITDTLGKTAQGNFLVQFSSEDYRSGKEIVTSEDAIAFAPVPECYGKGTFEAWDHDPSRPQGQGDKLHGTSTFPCSTTHIDLMVRAT